MQNNICYFTSRCQELEAHHKEQEVELKTLNELLLLAAQQKFKLQQQIDSWEVNQLDSKINGYDVAPISLVV